MTCCWTQYSLSCGKKIDDSRSWKCMLRKDYMLIGRSKQSSFEPGFISHLRSYLCNVNPVEGRELATCVPRASWQSGESKLLCAVTHLRVQSELPVCIKPFESPEQATWVQWAMESPERATWVQQAVRESRASYLHAWSSSRVKRKQVVCAEGRLRVESRLHVRSEPFESREQATCVLIARVLFA